MKNALLSMLFLLGATFSMAQVTLNAVKIDVSEVPAIVLDEQRANFPEATVRVWKKQTVKGKRGNNGLNYIAEFLSGNQTARARYTKDGKGVVAVIAYSANTLPQGIKDVAAADYSDMTLVKGENLTALKSGTSFFRVHLRKGAKKVIVYTDENGNEIQPQNVPEEVQEEQV